MKWIDYKDPPYNIPVLAKTDYGYKVLTLKRIFVSDIVVFDGTEREEDVWFEDGDPFGEAEIDIEKWCYIEDEDVE